MNKTTALENLPQDADSQEISKIADGIYGGKGGITQEVKRLFIQLVLFDLRENGDTSGLTTSSLHSNSNVLSVHPVQPVVTLFVQVMERHHRL